MKLKGLIIVSVLIVASVVAINVIPKNNNHKIIEEERKKRKEKKAEAIEARARYDFDMLKDPVSGKIPAGIFERERVFARMLPQKGRIINPAARGAGIALLNNYLPAGPNNVGGRTRALAYDTRYGNGNNVIISGCVSGGIMRSADGGQTWTKVTPEEDTHSFTALAQDTRTGFQDTWYAGGGEAYGNTASETGATYLGNGLWKSVNNGITWVKLPPDNITEINGTILPAGTLETFDHPFDYVHKIMVNPANGDVYIAGHRRILRSTNGGNSFQTVFSSIVVATSSAGQMDIAINNTGRIFLAVNGGYPDPALRGVWISATGNANSFSRVAGGQTIGVDSIPGWRGNDYNGDTKRILITLAPSNQTIGYVFYENGLSSESPELKPEADLFRFDIAGNSITWTNRSANMPDIAGGNLSGSDPIALQNGYNMLIAVKPNDPNIVFVGGTNLYRSTNGFSSTANTTWINGYNTNFTYQQYPGGHPDQHILVFNPSNVNQAIVGDDGGLRITNDVFAVNVAWTPLPNYQTLQYYYVTIDPEKGRNNFAGGAQDNGTQLRDKTGLLNTPPNDSNNHQRLAGGDGGALGFSRLSTADNSQYLYGSSQLGDIRRLRLLPSFSNTDIEPNNLTENEEGGFGEFVTNLRLNPDNTEDLFYVNFNRLFRTATASTVTPSSWTELTGVRAAVNPANPGGGQNISIRAMEFSRGTYSASHSLFLGTTNGKIFRLDDPRNAAPTAAPVNITPIGLTGNVQDIAVNPTNDNEILAVVSNYNTVSIWWTNNAKSSSPTWRNAEGNLTIPSIRSCEILVDTTGGNTSTEYYVGTSVGLYSVANLATTNNPVWQREGGKTLNFAVVQSIVHRPSDNTLLIGTHGNGMYYTVIGENIIPPNPGNNGAFISFFAPTIVTSSSGAVNYRQGTLTTVNRIIVQVFNMKGQLLLKQQRGYTSGVINFIRYPAGMYIVLIMSDDGREKFTQKVIKQ